MEKFAQRVEPSVLSRRGGAVNRPARPHSHGDRDRGGETGDVALDLVRWQVVHRGRRSSMRLGGPGPSAAAQRVAGIRHDAALDQL